MEFRPWLVLIEASQQETQALKILGGDEKILAQLKSISSEPKFLPVLALFHREQPDLAQLGKDWGEYKRLLDKKKMPVLAVQGDRVVAPPQNQPMTYLQWTEKVHAMGGDADLVRKRMDIDYSQWKPPIFKNEELEIYETDGPGDCIRYGKGYSFCISQPGNTMWQSYRDTQTSTFYFVYDKKRPETDPLHIVVVDMTRDGPKLTDANNATGNIAKYGGDAKAYLDHLYERGVPRGLFRNREHTEEEKEETETLGRMNYSLAWFKELSPDHKSKYIGRGHELTDEQFDYILDNGMESLVKQYAEVGRKLNDHQMDRMLGSKFRSTYLHFRVIANQHKKDLDVREYDLLSDKQRESLGDEVKFAMLLRKGSRDKAMELLPRVSSEMAVNVAAEVGDVDLLDHFEKLGAINKKYLMSYMHSAVKGQSRDSIVWLADRGAPTKFALPFAAKKGDLGLLKKLIEDQEKYAMFEPNKDGVAVGEGSQIATQLKYAAEEAAKMGHYEVFRHLTDPKNELVDLGSEFSWQKAGERILTSAVRSRSPEDKDGQLRIIKELLEAGFDIFFLSGYFKEIPDDIIDMFLDLEAQNEKRYKFAYAMLEGSANSGNLQELKHMIEKIKKKGISIRMYPILIGAAMAGSTEILDFASENLLKKRQLNDFELESLLRWGAYSEKTNVMDWALSKGAELDEDLVDAAVSSNKLKSVKWAVQKMGSKGVEALKKSVAKHGDTNPNDPSKKTDRSLIRKYASQLSDI